jgi:hypothetical protein
MTNPATPPRATGACLCGGVAFEVHGPLRPVVACHCTECRRWSGSFWDATAARRPDLTIRESGALTWYRSSDHARRGFCGTCGASLFWDHADRPYMAIAAGALDQPTGLARAAHIFMAEAADYVRITDGLASFPGGGESIAFEAT